MDNSAFGDASAAMYNTQWVANSDRSRVLSAAPQLSRDNLTPEDMIIHAAGQMQNGTHFPMDASISTPISHHIPYQQHGTISRQQSLPGDQYPSYTTPDGLMMDRNDQESVNSTAVSNGAHRHASSRSSANNEQEMRQLFHANRHRTLENVAGELHGNERGPLSERTRQIFTMIWINASCQKDKGSVPRGRVYTIYAARCAKERIQVLNPASFGKLVRVLFPGLKTRRLGVRGESKYHYVNFAVLEEGADKQTDAPPQALDSLPEPTDFDQSFNTASAHSGTNLTQGPLPSPVPAERPYLHGQNTPGKLSFFSHSIYHQSDLGKDFASLNRTLREGKSRLEYSFPNEADDFCDHTAPLELPPIDHYLPPGTDPDAARALSALYLSHCTSLVETIRFVKQKAFFHLFTSFQGTLTMPVQKLLGDPDLAPWITGCDLVTYQRMMRLLTSLTLSALPKSVLSTLRAISTQLVKHIRESFNGQPEHVIKAKEGPAAIFASLLERLGRVNLTAHAATNQMSSQANRLQMYLDWIRLIRPLKVAECVPTRGMDDVVELLLREMRDLIDPGEEPGLQQLESDMIYGNIKTQQSDAKGRPEASDNSTDLDPLDRMLQNWVKFLKSLPRKFPYASAAEIVWCVQQVGTAVMRDLTLEQGESYNTWWVTKVFIDEMLIFLVEQGGFLNIGVPPAFLATKSQTTTRSEATGQGRKRKSVELEDKKDGRENPPPHAQLGRALFPPNNQGNQLSAEMGGGESHDDSGIGIRTPEEDSPMDRFAFTGDPTTAIGGDAMETGSMGAYS